MLGRNFCFGGFYIILYLTSGATVTSLDLLSQTNRGEWGKSDLPAVFALYKAQIKSDRKIECTIGKII